MENFKTFFFYSLAFSTGLLFYTLILYIFYKIFLEEKTEEITSSLEEGKTEETASKEGKEGKKDEKIEDLENEDFLEDA